MADLLGIGKTGLFASKKAMETTGHNIANVNTEGYSRQRVKQTTGIPITQQGLVKGTGTRILSVNRFHDEFIERRLNKELTNSEFLKQRVNHLNQILRKKLLRLFPNQDYQKIIHRKSRR